MGAKNAIGSKVRDRKEPTVGSNSDFDNITILASENKKTTLFKITKRKKNMTNKVRFSGNNTSA